MTTHGRKEASPAYALDQLTRALRTAKDHPDRGARVRASDKVARWTAVLEGMADGTLRIGSRTPVSDTPPWVTLEVAHGGFATGRYLAEGPLRQHEDLLLARLPGTTPGSTERERLNLHFLGDRGQEELRRALHDGRYEIDIPEESALLVVTWLLDQGHHALALDLLVELRPLMHRIRFYPRFTERPRTSGTGVHVSTVGTVTRTLSCVRPSRQVAQMNTALAVWNPLYDALVALWLRTVAGDTSTLRRSEGQLLRREDGEPVAEGGSPCAVGPGDWSAERALWLARYAAAVREHGASGRHHARKSNFQILRRSLEACPSDPTTLSEGAIATIRHALACAVHKHGVPGESRALSLRAEQARVAALPLHSDIAEVIAGRLSRLPSDEGIPALELVSGPVAEDEHPRVPVGTELPLKFISKAERAVLAPIDDLVERGVIGSAEVLAIVLPQITSNIAAAGIEDRACRHLFSKTYTAFRRRRSLLLLNLEHQVTIDELPWMDALGQFRSSELDASRAARETLRDVTLLALEHFPQTILPNPLVREMATLSEQAGLDLPLVEELAADIFMGTFTRKFADASRLAGRTLAQSLYARYYDLPVTDAEQARRAWAPRRLLDLRQAMTDGGFDALCARRAREAGDGGSFVARNGAVLEQMQILTTYNLASLAHGLELRGELELRGGALASDALRWALDRQRRLPVDRYARHRATKNSAYAWRQAIFFLSFVGAEQQRSIVARVTDEWSGKAGGREALSRLEPALLGLRVVIDGGRFDESGRTPEGGRRLLAWSCGGHWLLP